MGFRRLTFLLSVTYALSFAACGDNRRPIFEDAMTDDGDVVDIDAPPDGPPDALMCGDAPNMNCGGACVNLNTDNNNCGACGEVCDTANGESCTNGLCCGAGQTNCGGECVNLNTDNDHCGSCAEVCDTGGGETCQNGTCCGGNNTACGNQCFDLQTDPNHCGTCNNACMGGTPDCSGGMCCPDGWIRCGNECVDPMSDEANCGACSPANGGNGVVCDTANGATCDDGICCASGTENCSGTCVNTETDVDNCGACGTPCGDNETCNEGRCCGAGTISCNGTSCTNTSSDPMNCGGCAGAGGDVCDPDGEVCDDGLCCGPGTQNCGTGCVDVLNDFNNCGACGSPCQAGEVCSSGSCVAQCGQNETQCPGGDCANLNTDHANCGTCGNACAPNEVCSGGTCAAMCASGTTECNGDCVDTQTDPSYCGNCTTNCGPSDTCSGGLCCPSGQVNTMGICCPVGQLNCGGMCRDPNDDMTCGDCNTNCSAVGDTCEADPDGSHPVRCCGPDQTNCNGVCVDLDTDGGNCGACGDTCSGTCDDGLCCPSGQENCAPDGCVDLQSSTAHCGTCGNDCNSGESCSNGLCCPDGQVNTDGICCNPGETRCGNECVNTTNDPDNCGGCFGMGGLDCGTDQFCQNSECVTTCDAPNDTTCGYCTNTSSDPNACGGPGDPVPCDDCASGGACNNGVCSCPAANPTECNLLGGGQACVDTGGVPIGTAGGNASHCGGCGITCGAGETCDDSAIFIAQSPGGATNATGMTATFTTTAAHGLTVGQLVYVSGVQVAGYNGTWTVATVPTATTFTATISSSGLAASGGVNATTAKVATGECCGPNLDACPGATGSAPNTMCVDKLSDENNCGGCGITCAAGETCTNGTCSCPFGTIDCGNAGCKPVAIDPNNCGACGNACGASTPYCVSNGCVAQCPEPLTECLTGGPGNSPICANLDSSNQNCGACGNDCAAGEGCVDGQCVPKFPLGPDPAKCVGGGPPIFVPDGTGDTECTGNLGSVSFTFAMCSRTNVGPLSQLVFTDAFNSLEGPHRPIVTQGSFTHSCNTDADCGATGQCVGDGTAAYPKTCVGGGVGINGTVSPVADTSKAFEVGGDFWVMGEIGLNNGGDTVVKLRTYNQGPWSMNGKNRLYGDAYIDGPISIGGAGETRIDGDLYTADTPCTASTTPDGDFILNNAGADCIPTTWDSTRPLPCGTAADLIPVKTITEYFRNPLRNDNAAVGLAYNALANPSAPVRLELPCGYYYLDSLGGNQPVTIVVKGRTGLFIGGAANINTEMTFEVEPTATLDMFVGSVVRIAHPITLGSPAYPRLTRMYIGSATGGGGGTSCTSNAQCSSGLCSACPSSPYGACSGTGTCTGGTNLSQAIDMSQGGYFNGLLWAGNGSFSASNAVEMYGSIFANYLDSSGALTIHYDRGAVQTGDECPPPPQGGSCESCRDCNNQACVNNSCGACTADSQCCPPLRCEAGSCVL